MEKRERERSVSRLSSFVDFRRSDRAVFSVAQCCTTTARIMCRLRLSDRGKLRSSVKSINSTTSGHQGNGEPTYPGETIKAADIKPHEDAMLPSATSTSLHFITSLLIGPIPGNGHQRRSRTAIPGRACQEVHAPQSVMVRHFRPGNNQLGGRLTIVIDHHRDRQKSTTPQDTTPRVRVVSTFPFRIPVCQVPLSCCYCCCSQAQIWSFHRGT